MKVQAESFHLNGHMIGFRPQTQKLESPYKTPPNTLAVKGLNPLVQKQLSIKTKIMQGKNARDHLRLRVLLSFQFTRELNGLPQLHKPDKNSNPDKPV